MLALCRSEQSLDGRLAVFAVPAGVIVPIGMVIGYFIVMAEPAVHVPDPSGRGDDIGCDSGKGNEHKPFRSAWRSHLGWRWSGYSPGSRFCGSLCRVMRAAIAMSFFVPKMFTAIAFDSGGVASGPMTATFLLPFAIGACQAVGGDVVTGCIWDRGDGSDDATDYDTGAGTPLSLWRSENGADADDMGYPRRL